MPHPQLFSGDSVISWTDLNIISIYWYLGLILQTQKEHSVLMEAISSTHTYFCLQVTGVPCHQGTC